MAAAVVHKEETIIRLNVLDAETTIIRVLTELHWLKIHDRIIFKILLLTHKAVSNTAPEYCDLIRFNVKSTTILYTCIL